MQSKATTVRQYLDELSPDRRSSIEVVRQVILANLGKGYEEGMLYGMIGYYVPHRLYPAGYHANPKQPLPFRRPRRPLRLPCPVKLPWRLRASRGQGRARFIFPAKWKHSSKQQVFPFPRRSRSSTPSWAR